MRLVSSLPRKLALLAMSAVMTAGAVTAVAAPAQAGCSGKLCVYDGNNFSGGGDYWNFGDSNFNGDQFINGVSENDHISSIDSWMGERGYFFTDSWWSGTCGRVLEWATIVSLSGTYNNRFSSWGYSEGYGCNDLPYSG